MKKLILTTLTCILAEIKCQVTAVTTTEGAPPCTRHSTVITSLKPNHNPPGGLLASIYKLVAQELTRRHVLKNNSIPLN